MALSAIIRNPGKFEGEPRYVRDRFWPMVLNGGESETLYDGDRPVSVFFLDNDDRAICGLAVTDYAIMLWESEAGFVHSRIVDSHEYADVVSKLAETEDGID